MSKPAAIREFGELRDLAASCRACPLWAPDADGRQQQQALLTADLKRVAERLATT